MSTIDSWVVLTSKSGHHREYGYPFGEILIRNPEHVQEIINETGIHDPIVKPYKDSK